MGILKLNLGPVIIFVGVQFRYETGNTEVGVTRMKTQAQPS
jgi:hypothetical protein